jgi:hypothetical protein
MTATLTKWYEERGRHEIIAGGKKVNLPSAEHSLILRIDDVNHGIQHDLDEQGPDLGLVSSSKRRRQPSIVFGGLSPASSEIASARRPREPKAERYCNKFPLSA